MGVPREDRYYSMNHEDDQARKDKVYVLHNDDDITLDTVTAEPLIPEGQYTVSQKGPVSKCQSFGQEKLTIMWEIVEGPHAGTILPLYAAIPSKKGPSSKLGAMWAVALGGRRPEPRERFSTSVFRGKYFLAQVRTSKKGRPSKGESLAQRPDKHESQWKSVIDCLSSCIAGGRSMA
jgi:hypothetical protein